MDVSQRRLSRSPIQIRTKSDVEVPTVATVQVADIPVYINNRDRLTSTKALTEWLLRAGTKNIVILDNDSTCPPLLEWYKSLPEGTEVVRQGNLGPWGFWGCNRQETQRTP